MAQQVAERVHPVMALRAAIEERTNEFAAVLPPHIRPDQFRSVATWAINQNPKLAECHPRTVFNALMQCAKDGLLPDGRQAVIVVVKSKDVGPSASYRKMTGGIRLLVQQSGEITRFEQTIVYQNDEFEYILGDRPQIYHRPTMEERGRPILVYSVAQYRDGTLSREIMTAAEINAIRERYAARDSAAWRDAWGEMARKTVARRHSKVLPMSTDAREALERDDEQPIELASERMSVAPRQRPRLAESLQAIGETAEQPRPRRGRPRTHTPRPAEPDDPIDEPIDEPADDDLDQIDPQTGEVAPTLEQSARDAGAAEAAADPASAPAGAPPPPTNTPPDPDYERGWRDARSGTVKTCLNSAINSDPRRHASWQAGFAAYHAAAQQAGGH